MIIINYLEFCLYLAFNRQYYNEIKKKWIVIAKEIEMDDSDEYSKTTGKAVSIKGLSKLKKISIEKAKGAVSSACYNAIKKKF